jgi:multisubunit Na+/H+ antiporter MnhE subunit
MIRLLLGPWLLFVFLREIVRSGTSTAWLIVRPGRRPVPALARMSYEGLSPTGAALLGSMITLTPGTTTIDVDPERRELLLHLLDGSDPDAVVDGIRTQFERPLRRLFPEQRP